MSNGWPYELAEHETNDMAYLIFVTNAEFLTTATDKDIAELLVHEGLVSFVRRGVRHKTTKDDYGNEIPAALIGLRLRSGEVVATREIALPHHQYWNEHGYPAPVPLDSMDPGGPPPTRHFPRPDRSKHLYKGYKTGEDPTLDIGWNEGWLSDLRPYRIEMWAEDQVTSMTLFMSTYGIEAMTDDQFAVRLVEEGLLEFTSRERYVTAAPFTDDSGNDMWSVNVVVADESSVFAKSLVPTRRYSFNPRVAVPGEDRSAADKAAQLRQMELGDVFRKTSEQHPPGKPGAPPNELPPAHR